MNNKKLEELQDDVIEALENALSEISQFKAGADTWFYLSIKNGIIKTAIIHAISVNIT